MNSGCFLFPFEYRKYVCSLSRPEYKRNYLIEGCIWTKALVHWYNNLVSGYLRFIFSVISFIIVVFYSCVSYYYYKDKLLSAFFFLILPCINFCFGFVVK